MAQRVLVAYGSRRGSTGEVAEAVAATLREHGHVVDVEPAGKARKAGAYDAVVLGGALYRGRWHRGARRFLKRERRRLASVPTAVYALGPRRDEAEAFERSRRQLERALAKAPEVEPASTAVFGGVDRERGIDLRDWGAIRAWTESFSACLDDQPSANVTLTTAVTSLRSVDVS
jgi:menaquinone-dependent protoporphyrinogen oxidase